ncbi:lanthionine synthetase LanC family protein [Streptomyces sp. 6N223]|uniref:lanthionine synthetase LanC family protein n=1 Tax=Streptomyces sp. 6N223 TaxID=3457412 RepID=UPI003FD5EA55
MIRPPAGHAADGRAGVTPGATAPPASRHSAGSPRASPARVRARPWDSEGPTLCHGAAGVLQAANRAGCAPVADLAATRILTLHDPSRRYGFAHVERSVSTDAPGFLTGAAGVALALADDGGLLPRATPATWDALLLLS